MQCVIRRQIYFFSFSQVVIWDTIGNGDSKVRDDRGTRLYEFGLIAGFIED